MCLTSSSRRYLGHSAHQCISFSISLYPQGYPFSHISFIFTTLRPPNSPSTLKHKTETPPTTQLDLLLMRAHRSMTANALFTPKKRPKSRFCNRIIAHAKGVRSSGRSSSSSCTLRKKRDWFHAISNARPNVPLACFRFF